ncbi:MAG: hypothetical protein WC994_07855 [Brumimicrobium sp.]
MRRIGFLLLLIIFVVPVADAQYAKARNTKKKHYFKNQRLEKPLFRWVTGDYIRHGIQFSFGPTYTFTPLKGREAVFQDSTYTNITHHAYRETKSRLGAFAEIGMIHITKHPRKYIHYYDWGIGFKLFGGGENTTVDSYQNDNLIGTREGTGEFYLGYLYGRFDVHSVYQINPHLFLDNALGVNVDYAIIPGNTAYTGAVLTYDQHFQGDIVAQLHYSFGLGIKPWADKGFFMIPSVEIPVFGMYEWNRGTPELHWFSSKYFPAQLRLKFVWLFKKGPNWCPPVETNEMDRQRANEYQNR